MFDYRDHERDDGPLASPFEIVLCIVGWSVVVLITMGLTTCALRILGGRWPAW